MNYPRMPRRRRDLNRPRKKSPEDINRQLDNALADSLPASDPVAITAPGGPVQSDEGSGKAFGQQSGENVPKREDDR